MKLILLSGGSGKRLWPLSNDSRSKQFLKVLRDESNQLQSMVQRVYGQLESINLHHSTVISTSKSQVDMIQTQLSHDVPLIIEPERRDTFPAIALAASYLYSVQRIGLSETICILPVDSYVEDEFFNRVIDLEIALNNSQAELALLGVKPTFPSSKYGYIVPKDLTEKNNYLEVSYFKEKPDEALAKKLIEEDALWNCGVFGVKLGFLINILKEKKLPIKYDELLASYKDIPKNSFDYEVVEKVERVVVVTYDGYWKDLGTWNTLTEEMGINQIGKGIISNDSNNTHLVNELDIPIVVMGINDAVVAASPDGILITDKASSPKIKDLMDGFEQRLMYEERRWGWYRVLDYTRYENQNEVLTRRVCVKKGKNLSYQLHNSRNEIWTIISGKGEFALQDSIRPIIEGETLVIAPGMKHAIKATTDLEFIEIQSGPELVEEDIIRICLTWEEVRERCEVELAK
ncbi:sugar phosphate nucleotidyltransferase [Paenibacillus sp. PAMC21692]|uniref:sugar phosphate nucleotidyltransferase n=1 Tax=Paenibacillus sp. PAMC21692 TaxID=2762320 RepID=UPI00164E5E36|nr:sugar phosphate nucleotidyltransferase [Paenibacillus sp. PAMC21692]QNK58177.1 mannose-1-phosphate guanylyltransferase [Paenibacillus sp. PAMC21692]